MQFWNNFAAKHPAAAKWVREGGLFVVVSNLITVFKYLLLQFLPKAFASLPVVDFGWPGIPVTLFGETFQWNILGYDPIPTQDVHYLHSQQAHYNQLL